MTPELIIGIVSAIIGVGFVKVWLYKLFKFKMDEGIILKFFEDSDKTQSYSTEVIAKASELSVKRVEQVCVKSVFFENAEGTAGWRVLNP